LQRTVFDFAAAFQGAMKNFDAPMPGIPTPFLTGLSYANGAKDIIDDNILLIMSFAQQNAC
jgi:hypothetical protein